MIRYPNDILGGRNIVNFTVKNNKRNFHKFGNRKGIKSFTLEEEIEIIEEII